MRIVQIAVQSDGPDYGPRLFALTDNGKVFGLWTAFTGAKWTEFPPLPKEVYERPEPTPDPA